MLGLWYWKCCCGYRRRSFDGIRWTCWHGCWRDYNGCWNVRRGSNYSISKEWQWRVQSQAGMDPDCSRSCRRSHCWAYCRKRWNDCGRNFKRCRKNRRLNRCICGRRSCCWRSYIGYNKCVNWVKTLRKWNWQSYASWNISWSDWWWNGLAWWYGRKRNRNEVLKRSIRSDSTFDKISSWCCYWKYC